MKLKSHCKHGHDIALVGRATSGACMECQRLRCIRYYYKNHDSCKQRSRNYHQVNSEKCKNLTKDWRKTENGKQYEYENSWKKLGLNFSYAEYKELLSKQLNCCAICKKNRDEFKERLALDHDHKTGKVRGLLCRVCNTNIVPVIEHYAGLIPAVEQYLKGELNCALR